MHDPLVDLAEEAVTLVGDWLEEADALTTRQERNSVRQMAGVVADPVGMKFTMRFVDRVVRPENHRVAAQQLAALVAQDRLPDFLSPFDRGLLKVGARLAPRFPGVVMPLANQRMRNLIGHLVVDAEPDAMSEHFGHRKNQGFRLNVNLLGEAVLGDAEAQTRQADALRLLEQADIDYVSVKLSSIVAQLNYWDFQGCINRVTERLQPIFVKAKKTRPATFVNLDMEEYHDLELTLAVFTMLLDEPELHTLDAGVAIQAYLPDSLDALTKLEAWATQRHQRIVDGQTGGTVKVRLVKGANLAMERVDAVIHGWEQAPYRSKAETDANFKRCLDWLFQPDRLRGVKVGVATHNLFDIAFAKLLAETRGVVDRVEFEMLEGMAPTHARLVRRQQSGLLLYTPVVSAEDFDVAISYLFRRLEENAADENFLHQLLSMSSNGGSISNEAERFRVSVRDRNLVGSTPQRTQNRLVEVHEEVGEAFHNTADTDPALRANRLWARSVVAQAAVSINAPIATSSAEIDRIVGRAEAGHDHWQRRSASDRRRKLHEVANELAERRGDLAAAMVHEARKTFAQADPEVSEAIDFSRYYADRGSDLETFAAASFTPLGVVCVVPPWNFPVAIPTGGVTAALAAGNAVVFKPAPESVRCAEIVAECCWRAGIPPDVLQFVRVPEDEVGRHLIAHDGLDAVILTGAYETAELFRSWKPDQRILGETSGKNSLVITSNADVDSAVAELVASAFGHSGQKCSAASLAICVGDVYDSQRLRRQLVDAASSLRVGPSKDLATTMGPLIREPDRKLLRGLTQLDGNESWLLEPHRLGPATWTPGIRTGVQEGSWFHQTECFGPVLGLMKAETLGEAVRLQNATPFGLTGGIFSLDESEIAYWLEHVQVGNAYINRAITGAIVRRQPFGGWKRSSIGPGAKTGGPNYIQQLGSWKPLELNLNDADWLERAVRSDDDAWRTEFSTEHDPSGLFCESNRFRYRPLERVAVRVEAEARQLERDRVLRAAERCGVDVVVSDGSLESAEAFADRLAELNVERVRLLGTLHPAIRDGANNLGIHVASDPVTAEGRIELLHYLREQAISETAHRYGNLL